MRQRLPIPTLALSMLLLAASGADAEQWDPRSTHALLVGVLEWRDPALRPFPKEGRVDRILERQLLKAGVPSRNIAFLEDRAATADSVKRGLVAVAESAAEGGTLIVYYAGHGMQHEREIYFASYDCDVSRPATTSFGMSDIARILERHWKGGRLLLLADCCYSGGLAAVARRFDGVAGAATLTSQNASNVSTANWTFTESIVAALRGDGIVDGNGDQVITFGECDAHVTREMRFLEAQLTRAYATPRFPRDLVIALVPPERRATPAPSPWRVGDYVEVEYKASWYRARVVAGRERAAGGGRVAEWMVHYLGYGNEWDEWAPPSRIRAPQGLPVRQGDPVEVEWKEKWWRAQVVQVEGDFAFIHYDGYGDEWDEWVTAKRLRRRGNGR